MVTYVVVLLFLSVLMSITFSYFSAAMVGTSTEGEGVLQSHQMAVDKQELRRLHHLTGAMLGGVVPAGGPVVAETVPYAVPDVGWGGGVEMSCILFKSTSTKQLFFLFQFYTIVIQK